MIISILAAAAVLWLIFGTRATGNVATVIVDNEEVLVLELDTDGQHEYIYGPVEMRFEVRGGRAAIIYSNCPDHLCVREGFIGGSGQMAVCLPNRAVLVVG